MVDIHCFAKVYFYIEDPCRNIPYFCTAVYVHYNSPRLLFNFSRCVCRHLSCFRQCTCTTQSSRGHTLVGCRTMTFATAAVSGTRTRCMCTLYSLHTQIQVCPSPANIPRHLLISKETTSTCICDVWVLFT